MTFLDPGSPDRRKQVGVLRGRGGALEDEVPVLYQAVERDGCRLAPLRT